MKTQLNSCGEELAIQISVTHVLIIIHSQLKEKKAKCIEVNLFQLKISFSMQVFSNLVCNMQVESYWSQYLCCISIIKYKLPEGRHYGLFPFHLFPYHAKNVVGHSVYSATVCEKDMILLHQRTQVMTCRCLWKCDCCCHILDNTFNEHRHLIIPPSCL